MRFKYSKISTLRHSSVLNGIMAFIPALISASLLYVGYTMFLKKSSEDQLQHDAMNAMKPNYSKTSFPKSKATMLAKRLYDAMHPNQSWSPTYDGTYEDEILDVFSLIKNIDDMKAVYTEFGYKDYRFVMVTDNLDLIGWLKAELSSSQFSIVNQKLSWI